MKNKILWTAFVVLLTAFSFISCRKDIGNYDYHTINEGTITNINASYSLMRGQQLVINPIITFTNDDSNDTSKYTYKWSSVDATVLPITETTIAKTRNLNWTVSLASISTAYTLYYLVTEKSTVVSWR